MTISYNVLSVPDVSILESHLKALQPRWVLFKDNLGYAVQIASKWPNMNVLHRDWAGYLGDDDLPVKITAGAWLTSQRQLGNLHIWRYVLNESGFSERTIAWLIQLIEFNAKEAQPLKLVIGNFSVGTPEASDWKRPDVVKLLKYLDQYREWLVLGLHDYWAGTVTSGFFGGYPDNAGVAPGTNGGKNLVPMDKWPKPIPDGSLFHCGRWRFLLSACKDLGINPPRIVVTEHGCDDVSDIKAWLNTLQKTDNQPIRAWRTLANQWHSWYPAYSTEAAYFEMFKYLDQWLYKDSPVEAQLIFSWGDSGGWDKFRVDNAPEFLKLAETYANTIIAKQYPAFPTDFASRKHTGDFTVIMGGANIRKMPTANSAKVGYIPEGLVEDIDYIPATYLYPEENFVDVFSNIGGNWIPVRYTNSLKETAQGWVFGGFLALYKPIPPVDTPAPPVSRKSAILSEIQSLLDELATLL